MARVGFDLDGVLYDFIANFRHALTQLRNWPREACTTPTRWGFYEDWGLSTAGFIDVCNEAADAGILFRNGDRAYGIHGVIKTLTDAGHTIHIVTDRSFGSHPAASQIATTQWLLDTGIAYDSLTFTADKTLTHLDWMIDDRPENVEALRGVGCQAFLLDRPWNQDADLPRVDCLDDYLKKVTAA